MDIIVPRDILVETGLDSSETLNEFHAGQVGLADFDLYRGCCEQRQGGETEENSFRFTIRLSELTSHLPLFYISKCVTLEEALHCI